MDWMSSCAYLSMPFFCGTQLETTPRCDDLFAGTAGKGLGYAHVCRYTVRINSPIVPLWILWINVFVSPFIGCLIGITAIVIDLSST